MIYSYKEEIAERKNCLRYPSFSDALRDLDDSLAMVHLFATLPAEKRFDIPAKAVETSRRLALEWQAYVVRTHALRKVFVSIKGYYFQVRPGRVGGRAGGALDAFTVAMCMPLCEGRARMR